MLGGFLRGKTPGGRAVFSGCQVGFYEVALGCFGGSLCLDKPVGGMRFDSITRVSLDNLRPLLSLFSADLAIDLGTVNTRVYARDRGIVVNEPSAVALDNRTGEVQAVGKEAKEMLGRTPGNLRVVKPINDGVIADFKVTEKMLNYFIQKAHQRRTLVHPRIIISIPSEITQVEKRAVTDAAYRAKAAEVHLVEQAMMAAIGAGLPVTGGAGDDG